MAQVQSNQYSAILYCSTCKVNTNFSFINPEWRPMYCVFCGACAEVKESNTKP